jgi:hypothetical protein
VILSKYLTVSEASLLAKGEDGKTNAEVLLSQQSVVAVLAKNYSLEYGFEIKNAELIKIFLTAEANAGEKSQFELLRTAFGIKKKEEKKDDKHEEKKEKNSHEDKHDAKAESDSENHEQKHDEVKHEEKHDEVKPESHEVKHEEKNDDAPKEGEGEQA